MVFTDLVADGVGVIHHIFVGQFIADKQLVESFDYLREQLFFFVFGSGGAKPLAGHQFVVGRIFF